MSSNFDYKKEWEKTKKQLIKFGKEASVLAKKGEEELVKFSQKSKIQVDVTATHLKIEKLYYLIGKEYVNAKTPSTPTAALKKHLTELEKLLKEEKALKSKLKAKPKKTASKTVKKKVAKKSAKKKSV